MPIKKLRLRKMEETVREENKESMWGAGDEGRNRSKKDEEGERERQCAKRKFACVCAGRKGDREQER